jgi:hypothetical protein
MNIEDVTDEQLFAELLRRYPTIETVRLDDADGCYTASTVRRHGDLWYVSAGSRLDTCELSLAEGMRMARSIAGGS